MREHGGKKENIIKQLFSLLIDCYGRPNEVKWNAVLASTVYGGWV